MKKTQWRWLFLVPLTIISGGCIVHDQFTTLTINPDGSAQLIIFRSNIRSTQAGQKADSEIAEYRASFNNQTQNEFIRILESGARIESAEWVRKETPLANIINVLIPDAATLEKFASLKDDDGTVLVKTKFITSQNKRRLSLQVTLNPEQVPSAPISVETVEQIKRARASGISDLRLAVTSGKITEAQGFIIANDKQSALLDIAGVISRISAGNGNAGLFVQWEVSD